MKVPPSFSGFYAANGVFPYSIVLCDFSLKSAIPQNGNYLNFRELRSRAAFSAIARAVRNAILLIRRRRVPTKIGNMIVGRIAVIVAALHARGSRPDKGLKHKFVGAHDLELIIAPETREWPIVAICYRPLLLASSFGVSEIAAIRNLIKALKPNNRQPAFHLIPHMCQMGIYEVAGKN